MTKFKSFLEINLAQLRRTEPELADRIAQTPPADLTWLESKSGVPCAITQNDGRPIALASKYDPVAEAKKLADTVDYGKSAGVVVLGMGLGYHVERVASRINDQSLLVVYEPDTATLRAAFERIDHTSWLGRPNVILADADLDRSSLLARIEPFAGMLTMGTVLVTHPASRQLHGDALNDFGQLVTEVLAFCRTNVATAMVNASRTYRNLSLNLGPYAGGATTDELVYAAKGLPAVCVGAGPSLAKNVELLADPAVRDKVVVISAQTTLKPLLDRGIRPDFVTALDYHEISRRFYEGLPDLPDVTLVAEPLAHPNIVEAYPGPVRMTSHYFLDKLLGDMARATVPVPYGATVAHLSFYLAQHLGCDPIIMIGQDLGFSDGLYYCPGTAIHDVWAPELNAFNSLEMMEWQRVVRHRGHLQKKQDIHGQPIYSDEQMLTYLKQFERDFAKAPQTIIDATEGGLPKEHTVRLSLAEALRRHAKTPVPDLPLPSRELDPERLEGAEKLLHTRIGEVAELRKLSRKTQPILNQMRRHQRDQRRMKQLFDRLAPLQRQVAELSEVFRLVNDLNAVGAFNRARSDRAIDSANTDEFERQTQRLLRDIENVDWLIQACDETLAIFHDAAARIKSSRARANSDSPADTADASRSLAA